MLDKCEVCKHEFKAELTPFLISLPICTKKDAMAIYYAFQSDREMQEAIRVDLAKNGVKIERPSWVD
jgi:hypothetical protein